MDKLFCPKQDLKRKTVFKIDVHLDAPLLSIRFMFDKFVFNTINLLNMTIIFQQ